MKSTSLLLRKISLVEYLLGIQDEKVFGKIKSKVDFNDSSIANINLISVVTSSTKINLLSIEPALNSNIDRLLSLL